MGKEQKALSSLLVAFKINDAQRRHERATISRAIGWSPGAILGWKCADKSESGFRADFVCESHLIYIPGLSGGGIETRKSEWMLNLLIKIAQKVHGLLFKKLSYPKQFISLGENLMRGMHSRIGGFTFIKNDIYC